MDTLGCDYTYTRQPPPALSCNPYTATRLALVCTVEGPTAPRFSIVWFTKNSREDEELEASLSHVNIDVEVSQVTGGTAQFTRRSSRLTVTPLFELDDVGDYWCQVRLENGTLFHNRSNILTLGAEGVYASFNRCRMSQFVEQGGCAGRLQITEHSVTTVGNMPIIPTNAGLVVLTISTSDISPSPLASGPSNGTEMSSKNLAALYVAVAVVLVFCIVIMSLSIVILVLCRKKCAPVRFKTGGELA